MDDLREVYKKLQAGDCVVLDVREEEELREAGMADGALWMPMSKMDSEEWQSFKGKLPKNKAIYVYCLVGGRSARVAGVLTAEGYEAKNIGGLKDWKAAQLPVKKYP